MTKFTLFITLAIGLVSCGNSGSNEKTSEKSSLLKGLVLYTSFDEDGDDLSGNENHARLVGAKYSTNAAIGNACVAFDGVDDYVAYPSGKSYFKNDYSISIWCYWEGIKTWTRILDFNQDEPQTGETVTWLLGRPDSTENAMWFDQWIVEKGIAVESILNFENKAPADASLNFNIATNKWQHYVIVYNHLGHNSLGNKPNSKGIYVPLQGRVYLYVDGIKVSESEYCLNPKGEPTKQNWLGRSAYPADPFFKGRMDEIRIYNRQLTDSEVIALFEQKK